MSIIQKSLSTQPVIAYYRRSTDTRQRYSLEAQKSYVEAFCDTNNMVILHSFTETASGSNMERTEWKKALSTARKLGLPIIVKSLSRLGRDASAVIATLNTEKVIVADRGLECDRLTLNLLAVIDQNELERISKRTKAGLARAKANGVILGNPNPTASLQKGRETIKKGADLFALKMEPIITPMLQNGLGYKGTAERLNQAEIKTRRGGKWSASTIRNLALRLDNLHR